MTDGVNWPDIVGAVGGTVGVLGGVVFGIASWRIAARSARSAAASASEARTLSRIEASRHHHELAPQVEVSFKWGRDTIFTAGCIFAEISNRTTYKYAVVASLFTTQTDPTSKTRKPLPPESVVRFRLFPLAAPRLLDASPAYLEALGRDVTFGPAAETLRTLTTAFQGSELRGARLEIQYSIAEEKCECDRSPASNECGHWTTRHVVDQVGF